MNIFVLDLDPRRAAKFHCDKHVCKMVLETAQLLSGVVHLNSPQDPRRPKLYRLTHKQHPCAVWARQSFANYRWLLELGQALCEEYTYRYGRVHASQAVIELCSPSSTDATGGLTPFAQAMPAEYRDIDPVQAYRRYYQAEKLPLARYTRREAPAWLRLA